MIPQRPATRSEREIRESGLRQTKCQIGRFDGIDRATLIGRLLTEQLVYKLVDGGLAPPRYLHQEIDGFHFKREQHQAYADYVPACRNMLALMQEKERAAALFLVRSNGHEILWPTCTSLVDVIADLQQLLDA